MYSGHKISHKTSIINRKFTCPFWMMYIDKMTSCVRCSTCDLSSFVKSDDNSKEIFPTFLVVTVSKRSGRTENYVSSNVIAKPIWCFVTTIVTKITKQPTLRFHYLWWFSSLGFRRRIVRLLLINRLVTWRVLQFLIGFYQDFPVEIHINMCLKWRRKLDPQYVW